MTEKVWRFGMIVLLIALTVANGRTFLRMVLAEPVLLNNVYIDNLNMGGMTRKEAEATLAAYTERLAKTVVYVSCGEVRTKEITLKQLGFHTDYQEILDQAFQEEVCRNPFLRYFAEKEREKEARRYTLKAEINEEAASAILEKNAALFATKPKEATLTRVNGTFVYGEEKNGRKLSIELTLCQLRMLLEQWDKKSSLSVLAITEKVSPRYTKEFMQRCNTLLAEYSTSYALKEDESETDGRTKNIENGAKKMTDIVLLPGESFSCQEALAPFTEENGYAAASAYLQGRVVESVGGGVCQLSTTLYNAVLFAELEVVERSPHSMTVGYVPLARDAAIAEEDKDFCFRNNTEAPVYIEAKAEDGLVTFRLYGEAKKAGREVRFQTVILETTEPGEDVVIENKNLAKGYFAVLQNAHTGYLAELYKIVYQNGREEERVLINTSLYQAAPRYVERGEYRD